MSEQSYRSAGTLLAQLASGETTSVALVNHYFSRMAQFNKPLNAVCSSTMRWRWRPPRAPIVSDWRGAQGACCTDYLVLLRSRLTCKGG